MKEGQTLWTREELILAINLYLRIEFGKIHNRNPEVIHLANLIGRSANSVSYKLVNFASLDPSIRNSGRKGAVNASKLDKEIWNEFYNNWDKLPYESEQLRAKFENVPIEIINKIDVTELPKEGKERARIVKVRVNQNFFRAAIMGSYNNTCCITGIKKQELLIASHINRWADDEKNRMNPQNGLAMNGLHDKAYENGLITITPDFHVLICKDLLKSKEENIEVYFKKYHEKPIILPSRFLPKPEFLANHFKTRFQG